jgi:hypothetical protein
MKLSFNVCVTCMLAEILDSISLFMNKLMSFMSIVLEPYC